MSPPAKQAKERRLNALKKLLKKFSGKALRADPNIE